MAHGHPYEREHVLYPFSYDRGFGYGPDRLCDEIGCEQCVGHSCDCDVCTQRLAVPSLRTLMDNHDLSRARSINWEKEDMENDLKAMLAGLKHNDYVTASGVDTRGHKVTRVGFMLREPKEVKAQRNGTSTKAWRVFVGQPGTDANTRNTWVTLFPDADGGRVERIVEPKVEQVEKGESGKHAAKDSKQTIRGRGPELERKRVVLVACGGTKSTTGTASAGEMYVGNYHVACRNAAEVLEGATLILSAKYGLVPLHQEIEAYDIEAGGPEAIDGAELKRQAEEMDLLDAEVTVLGGGKYVSLAREVWPGAETPLSGGIGQQLKQLASIYGGDPEDEGQVEEPEGRPGYSYKGSFRDIPNLPSRGRPHKCFIWFGGKAGKRRPEPERWIKAGITYTGEGAYEVYDARSNEPLMMCRLASQIHWAPVESAAVEEGQEDDAPGFAEPDETPVRGWQKHKMGDFVSWSGQPMYFRYGGLAKCEANSAGPMVRVRWAESRNGRNKLIDVHTNEVVDVVHSMSNIWAVPATGEEIAAMPPLVELPDARPDYSLPPEERDEDLVDDEPEPQPRKPIRSGVLFEGWLGEQDPQSGRFRVLDDTRREVIGWLSADYTQFEPIGV
ncbi:DUF6884 domain-containing protein [Streptomyces decoyicus]|uniref:DUF6884 domain-containing protein n=1 Tax=Streptomyces decoyicus TaxID=249567 RepID=UPI0036365989